MYRAVKRLADAAAGTQRLARPDFLSLGRCCSVSRLDRPLSERPPAESGPRSTRRDEERMNGARADKEDLYLADKFRR